jgi:hypothetical protein
MLRIRHPFVFAMLLLWAPALAAQTDSGKFEAGVQFSLLRQHAFAVNDNGFGGRFTWYLVSHIGLEAETTFFPKAMSARGSSSAVSFSSNRIETLLGARAGHRFKNFGFFGKIRPGLMRFAKAPHGVACVAILIYPPPLECSLSRGSVNFALDLGGAMELYPSGRTSIRIDLGDTMIRFPPAYTLFGQFKNDFNVHNFQVNLGLGYRF